MSIDKSKIYEEKTRTLLKPDVLVKDRERRYPIPFVYDRFFWI